MTKKKQLSFSTVPHVIATIDELRKVYGFSRADMIRTLIYDGIVYNGYRAMLEQKFREHKTNE